MPPRTTLSSLPPPSKHVKLTDVGDNGSVPTIDHPECSTSVIGDENDVAPLEEIPTVDLDRLSSQSSDVDADNEDVGGDCELSPSVEVNGNDDIYLESVSISKLVRCIAL